MIATLPEMGNFSGLTATFNAAGTAAYVKEK
jgi:hypothetical protein